MSEGLEPALQTGLEWENRLIAENLRRVFSLLYRMVGNLADAQDLTQETFIKALQRRAQLKDPERAAQWLCRIATNTAIDFLRRQGRGGWCEIEDGMEPVRNAVETPEQMVLRAERRELLEDALRTLTPRERAALILRDVEDLPAAEVARYLNCSKATVRSHIANARVKFRRFLAERRR